MNHRARSVQTGGEGSKYDDFWAGQLPQIRAQVHRAAAGKSGVVSTPGLARLGARQSWSGMAGVPAREMTRSSGAHPERVTGLTSAPASSGSPAVHELADAQPD